MIGKYWHIHKASVWKMKKEKGLSLRSPIEAEIPRRLKPFRKDLIAMHNIVAG